MAAAAVPADPLDAIMAVMARAFDAKFGEAWNRRQVSDALVLPSCHHALIGADGALHAWLPAGEAAGFYLSRAVLDEEELLLLGVDPAYRRRGFGAALLEHFAAEAAQRDVARLFLEMRSGNPAGALYRANGFRQIGMRPAYYRGLDGTRLDALSFERLL